MDAPLNGINRRKAESEIFENRKILKLQDDEINRLSHDLMQIRKQIEESENHLNDIKLMLTRKKSSLQTKIKTIPKKITVIKSQMVSNHSQELELTRANHSQSIMQVRKEYKEKASKSTEESVQASYKTEMNEIARSIESTRSAISSTIQQQISEREARFQQKIQKLANQTDIFRRREAELIESIDIARKELQETKTYSQLRRAEGKIAAERRQKSMQERSSEYEEMLLSFSADALSEENELRENSHIEISELHSKISAQEKRAVDIKTRARELKMHDNKEIIRAKKEIKSLEMLFEEIQNEQVESDTMHKQIIISEKEKQEKLTERVIKSKAVLKSLREENQILLAELKRIDFMIYGRNGQWQNRS